MRRSFGKRSFRPRLTLLLAAVAALLLVPAASASANAATEILFAGEGSGWVKGAAGSEGGEPHLECHWNGSTIDIGIPGPGECKVTAIETSGFTGISVSGEADVGSELFGWEALEGFKVSGCSTPVAGQSEGCSVLSFGTGIKIKATFNGGGPTGIPLTINPVGGGSGQVDCEVNGEPTLDEPCEAEYEAGTELKLIAAEDEGSSFEGFENGTNDAAGCTTSPCGPFTLEEESEVDANFALETRELTISETGPGSVSVECEEGSGFEACAKPLTELDYGTEVKVTAEPDIGAETTAFSGTDSAAGCALPAETCTFTITEDSSVTVEFALIPPQPLTIEVEGEGEVSATEPPNPVSGEIAGCEEAAGECSAEYAGGTEVPLTAIPDGSSHFVEWEAVEGNAGTCNGTTASCETGELQEPTKLVAIFAPTTTSPLSVFVTGNGSVSADSGTISGCTEAGGASCEGLYEGTVTLTETPAGGYVFAGWLGCKHKSATQCEVTVDAEREVYAVFLKEGTEGEPGEDGEDGKNIVLGTATAGECPEGGITVEVEGEPLTKRAICNGEEGEKGDAGNPGAAGPQGPQGPTGSQGPGGPAGAVGPAGPAGPQGAQGPAGKVKVTCKVKGKKVQCVVKTQNKRASKRNRLRWALMQGGHAVSHGEASVQRLQHVLNHARPGHYVLHVAGQKGGTRIFIR